MKTSIASHFTKLVPILVLVTIMALVIGLPVSASSVTPIEVAGNPTCVGLGYDFGFKPQPEPPPTGTYTFPGTSETVNLSSDGTFFSWTSTLSIDAVIVKGGNNANVFVYDPPAEATHDEGLYSPDNSSGGPAAISHIEFCYDFEVEVSKTAVTTFTRTFNWTIDKSVTPGTLNMFTGDSGQVTYTVAVTKTGSTDSNWAVSGQITVHNPAPVAATVTSVTDSISGVGDVTVNCGATVFPYQLASGGNLVCSYSSALPDGAARVNTATATTSGAVASDSGTANVTFGDPTTVVNGTINVDDTYDNKTWQFSNSGSVTYTRPFTCDAGEGTHNNTATIRETGQNDSASVTVNCYELTVRKDADTALTRKWNWTIDKSVGPNQTNLLLSDGQLFTVNYQITVNTASVDSGWTASGNISVHNPAPIGAPLLSVSDVVSGGFNATVTCPVTFPYTLAAGGTLNCTYTVALPNATARINTATATIQNTNFMGQPSGTTGFSGTVNVSFTNATVTELDECIEVSDTHFNLPLGTVCAGDAPETFNYSLDFGKHADADIQLVCGPNTHNNTASFVTNDTGATGNDTVTVNANVTCATGCTLTPGYWKTHSHRGPAPYDNAWLAIGAAGADTTFFLSGTSYYNVLWTAPRGNVYYILAHAYIAAKLNILNGASAPTAVNTAITQAEAFFATKTPTSSLTRAQRNAAIALATTLDNYNNGLIGPGHCSE